MNDFRRKATLYSLDYRELIPPREAKAPLSICMGSFYVESSSPLEEDELSIFEDVLRHEAPIHEPRGLYCGSMSALQDGQLIDLRQQVFDIPAVVEPDVLDFTECGSTCVLLIEHIDVFRKLAPTLIELRLPLTMVTGVGMPRATTRRLLHHLSKKFSIPVYVLADNDTWGYFMAALLRRGTIAPDSTCDAFGVRDTRFLGMRSQDVNAIANWERLLRPWDPVWSARIAALRTYTSFASDAWQEEFTAFERQQGAFDLQHAVNELGPRRFWLEYILPAIDSGRGLPLA